MKISARDVQVSGACYQPDLNRELCWLELYVTSMVLSTGETDLFLKCHENISAAFWISIITGKHEKNNSTPNAKTREESARQSVAFENFTSKFEVYDG